MPKPNVRVVLDKKEAVVEVLAAGIVAEVRNYAAKPKKGDASKLWTDEKGRACVRYFVSKKGEGRPPDAVAEHLERFAGDLARWSGIEARLALDPVPDGLHVLTIGKADYYFRADNGGYDGWGMALV